MKKKMLRKVFGDEKVTKQLKVQQFNEIKLKIEYLGKNSNMKKMHNKVN